ncbi:unnamed protein product [Parajaminaea phylloscopi]
MIPQSADRNWHTSSFFPNSSLSLAHPRTPFSSLPAKRNFSHIASTSSSPSLSHAGDSSADPWARSNPTSFAHLKMAPQEEVCDAWDDGIDAPGPNEPVSGPQQGNGSKATNGKAKGKSKKKKENNKTAGKDGNVAAPAKGPSSRKQKKKPSNGSSNTFPGPSHTLSYLRNGLHAPILKAGTVKAQWVENPKNPLIAYVSAKTGKSPKFSCVPGSVEDDPQTQGFRVTVIADGPLGISGYGDARTVREAEIAAAFDAIMLLAEKGLLDAKSMSKPEPQPKAAAGGAANSASTQAEVTLSSGQTLTADRAREFMEFYCKEFRFGKPMINIVDESKTKKGHAHSGSAWTATMTVGGAMVGTGSASNKKAATTNCYLDTVAHIENCDPQLFARFNDAHRPGAAVGSAPHVMFRLSDDLHDEIRDVCKRTTASLLFSKRPKPAGQVLPGEQAVDTAAPVAPISVHHRSFYMPSDGELEEKSDSLLKRLEEYHGSSRYSSLRKTREQLPVMKNVSDILVQVALHQVTICMAATGSGKSTQVPQILLDDAILQGNGAKTNVICTQPRRIAAISLAQRVASERGESVGESVGYQVRFESSPPEPNGSITYCTTGVFMRRMQNALNDTADGLTWLDTITHVVLDEVHERDVQTDLLLVVLKKILEKRRHEGKPDIKVILMSATVDPTLFQSYFVDATGRPAPVVSIPGRAFPVEKRFMEETVPILQSLQLSPRAGGWVWQQKNVQDYVHRELVLKGGMQRGAEGADVIDDLEIPYPLVSLYIAHAISSSDDGHVLVFLPGWDEIKVVNSHLTDPHQFPLLGLNFNDRSKFEIHILHSSVPVADQQAVFSPPPHPDIRRVILSTNIAETSVTIPDVTVVIDTGRVKEMRHDPSRHLSSLVSAWVGSSNLNQRAGRAGRHRPGEYFGVLSQARYEQLSIHQTVEMQRADLTDVVLHIKALDLPGMEPEDVLEAAIEPPAPERVSAAINQLRTIGALDANKALTSLGSVLLGLPIDAAMGKMVLYGLFFRCIEPAVTMAAILTTRDPFLAPLEVKQQAAAVKESWSPSDYRSDALAIYRAYTTWSELQSRGEYNAASRFAHDNFLSRPTLLQIKQVAGHLLKNMGSIIELLIGQSAGAYSSEDYRGRRRFMPEADPALNVNSNSMPLLAALVAMASTPKFAIRRSEKQFQTFHDKTCFIHPSSVCHLKHTKNKEDEIQPGEKELLVYGEKTQNVSQLGQQGAGGRGGGPPQTLLRTVTRLDPLTYILFGAGTTRHVSQGVMCDDWLPIKGHFQALDDVEHLKSVMDASMLRVFEGIVEANRPPARRPRSNEPKRDIKSSAEQGQDDWDAPGPEADESVPTGVAGDDGLGDRSDLSLSPREVAEFEELTKGIVTVLNRYAAERQSSLDVSRSSTRPGSPNQSYTPFRPSSPVQSYRPSSPSAPFLGGASSRLNSHSGPWSRTPSGYSSPQGPRNAGSNGTSHLQGAPWSSQNGQSHSAQVPSRPAADAAAGWAPKVESTSAWD